MRDAVEPRSVFTGERMIDRSRCLQDVPQEGPYSSARSAFDPGAFGEGQILVSKRSTRGGSSHERSLRHQTARAAKNGKVKRAKAGLPL